MKISDLRDQEEKFVFKPQRGKLRKQTLLIVILISLIGLLAADVQAAFSDNFDSLLADLQTLAPTLSGSSNKTIQKQYKVVSKDIAAINKPSSSLATDLKTATTIAKDLQTAFPNDAVLSNLVAGVFAGILSDTTDDLDALQVAAEALPTGKAQTEALVAAAKAQTALNAANAATNQKSLTTALTSTLKSIAVGDKDLTIKSGGGGTSGSGQYFKANIGGENFTAKILSVTNASDSGNIVFLGVIPPKNFNFEEIEIDFLNFIGIGTYYADDTPDTDFEFVYFHDTATSNQQWDTYYGGGSGSLTITSYNSATGTAAGNFDITVVNDSDPSQNMQITGTFSLQGEDLVGY